MRIKYYWNLLRGKTAALNPAKLDLRHIWAVIQSWFRSLFPVGKHIREQIIWRRTQVIEKSPTCWIAGNCVQCGCFMIEKTTADMGCENEPFCYPEMMDKKKWEKYKTDNDIRLFQLT